jgi:hypothetical protein
MWYSSVPARGDPVKADISRAMIWRSGPIIIKEKGSESELYAAAQVERADGERGGLPAIRRSPLVLCACMQVDAARISPDSLKIIKTQTRKLDRKECP